MYIDVLTFPFNYLGLTVQHLKIVLVLLVLGYAAYTDVKTRTAYRMLWYILGSAGIIINTYLILDAGVTMWLMLPLTLTVLFSLCFCAILVWVLRWGLADALAVFSVTLMFPFDYMFISQLLLLSGLFALILGVLKKDWEQSFPFLLPLFLAFAVLASTMFLNLLPV